MTSRLVAANLESAVKDGKVGDVPLLFEALRGEIKRASDYMNQKLVAA